MVSNASIVFGSGYRIMCDKCPLKNPNITYHYATGIIKRVTESDIASYVNTITKIPINHGSLRYVPVNRDKLIKSQKLNQCSNSRTCTNTLAKFIYKYYYKDDIL